ncbi:MAG: hypothetical protein E6J90_17000 [Deltaproteobacteria bacterium]|nr:MAG: hypothetical protein E6J90_17000 [Deltaproteobacteria bacterium]
MTDRTGRPMPWRLSTARNPFCSARCAISCSDMSSVVRTVPPSVSSAASSPPWSLISARLASSTHSLPADSAGGGTIWIGASIHFWASAAVSLPITTSRFST